MELINSLHCEPSWGTEEKRMPFIGTKWRLSVRCVFRQELWLFAGTPCWECSLSQGRCSWKLKSRRAADWVMMDCPALIYSFMFVQSFISNGKCILKMKPVEKVDKVPIICLFIYLFDWCPLQRAFQVLLPKVQSLSENDAVVFVKGKRQLCVHQCVNWRNCQ